MFAVETEKSQVVADLKEVIQESDIKSDKNKELVSANQNLEAKLAEMESVLKNLKYGSFFLCNLRTILQEKLLN